MTSPTATRLGPPATPTLLLGRSRVQVGEPSVSLAEMTPTPPELQSPISSAQPGTSSRARPPTGAQSTAEDGLETSTLMAPSSPTLMVPAPIYLRGSSQPDTTGTQPPTPTPAGFQPTAGGRPSTPPQPQLHPTTRPEVPEPRPRQPSQTGRPQPSPLTPPGRSIHAPPPSATPQPLPTTSQSAGPPPTPPVTLPQQPLPTPPPPSIGRPLLTPETVLAIISSPQSTNRRAQLPIPRTPPTTPGGGAEARSWGPASTPESPQPPPQTASPMPAGHWQPRVEPSEDCCVCYETLAAPLVPLRTCPHRLHLPCHAALRVRAATDLRYPACRATVTVGQADRRAL